LGVGGWRLGVRKTEYMQKISQVKPAICYHVFDDMQT